MSKSDDWLENIRFVAHEMKAPIGAIKGFVELTEAMGPLNDKQIQYLGRVVASSQRLERLVEVMLEAARIDTGKPLISTYMNLGAVVQHEVELLEPLAHQMNVTVHVEIAPDLGLIRADQERLSHVVSNLISNAIKYNRVGGEVWVHAYGDDDGVYLSVRDTGKGIHPEEYQNVFKRFYRVQDPKRKVEGTGLGLYIVKSLVEMHGGSMELSSEMGVGSTFLMKLPRGENGLHLTDVDEETRPSVVTHAPKPDAREEH